MHVRVRYFARLRDIAGCAEELVELTDGETAEALYERLVARHPSLRRLRPHLRVAINLEFEDWTTVICDGDELAFIPPVSGGSAAEEAGNPDGRFFVTRAVLRPDVVEETVRRSSAGALVTFRGVVRDRTGERDVVRLEYDAYVEMALAKLRETAEEAEQRWPVWVAIHHRYGAMGVGEVAVVIAVSSPHRKEAFRACEWVIDTLKEVVPIWKKEISADGAEWIGKGP